LGRDVLFVNEELSIPLAELGFQFSRSSGPGGQRVNRTATRVELRFDVRNSPSLSPTQRLVILDRLRGYIDREGVLHLVSQSTRSQWRNRQDAIARFARLIGESLRTPPRRIGTRPSRSATERRLRRKRARSLTKRLRRPPAREE